MLRSKFSNIIATSRLLPHFSTENISVIKSCILEQLGCENESQFLCKVLQSLYPKMPLESTTIIKDKATQIADQQPMILSNSKQPPTATSKNVANSDKTVFKHIQQRYTDPLSRLHSDIIDYLGTFLNKKQSIEIGYLNKQLYIETQKYSYLF